MTLGATTFLVSDSGGAITFDKTINSSIVSTPEALTVSTSGAVTFGGAVGGTIALASLTTNGGGPIAINGGAVTTTNAQSYDAAVTLGAAVTTLTGSSVTFSSTVNSGGFPLAITADSIDFNGGAGSVTGTSTLLLQPTAANVSVGIGSGAAGAFNLSDTDLAALANGFTAITIGRADGAASQR